VKNVTQVELSQILSQCDSSRIRVTKNRDLSRAKSLTQVALSLVSRPIFLRISVSKVSGIV